MKIIKVKELFDSSDSKDAFADWISGWMPHTTYLPEELRKTFIFEVIEKYLTIRPQSGQNGKITYFDYWLEFLAEKA